MAECEAELVYFGVLDTFTSVTVLLSSAQVVDHTKHMQLSCFMRKQLYPSLGRKKKKVSS